MRYLPSAPSEDRAMLDAIGVKRAEDLLVGIPEALHLNRPLDLPAQMSELEVTRAMEAFANANVVFEACFLGAGAYQHFVPSAIDAVTSRQEWFTAYTPYQPEVSQGTLQHIFEYQTLICDMAGLEVSNASLYDGGTACVEAALMAVRLSKKRHTVLVSRAIHPYYREVLATALATHEGLHLVDVGLKDGVTDLADLTAKLGPDVAAVMVGYPNFFGCIEDLKALSEPVKAAGAMLVSVTQEILSLGWIEAPGKVGADLACGEAMSLGNSMSFGGPYLGFMAVKDAQKREMPGRLVGQTVDLEGRRGFVLTLASREQHIRRDKATSNICSNQGLVALRANMFMQLAGPVGLKGLAEQNVAKAQYLRERLLSLPVFTPAFDQPYFNEFALRYAGDIPRLRRACVENGILPGLSLECYYPELPDGILWCATETTTREQIEKLVDLIKGL